MYIELFIEIRGKIKYIMRTSMATLFSILNALLLAIFSFLNSFSMQSPTNSVPVFAIAIHGGAGTILKKNMSEEKEKEYRQQLTLALNTGYTILQKGGASLDAAEAAVRILEDSPLFNAGKGSVFTNEGTIEMDASVMDGKTLGAGAVAGVTTVKNPIGAARRVMEKSPHVLLTGKGAEKFAAEQGLEIVNPIYFKDSLRFVQWQKLKEQEAHPQPLPKGGETEQLKKNLQDGMKPKGPNGESSSFYYSIPHNLASELEFNMSIAEEADEYPKGTVGAVALDQQGNLAAATSTGGMMNKRYGRVGDSPIIGAGTYANNKTCAVSGTGHGEFFIRLSVARDIAALIEYKGLSVEAAAGEVINKKLAELGGTGGVIAMDAKGNIAMPFNTEGMYRGFVKQGGKIWTGIYKEEVPSPKTQIPSLKQEEKR